jgi:predicted RNase H-like HicB family nuclease
MRARISTESRLLCAGFRFVAEDSRAYLHAMQRFRIEIHRVMGSYFAHVTDLPGCSSRGRSEVEALENARCAIRAYLVLLQAVAQDKATVRLEITA